VTGRAADHCATSGGLVLVGHIRATAQAQGGKQDAGKQQFGNTHVIDSNATPYEML
jgi:hypothetical protein